SSTQILASAGRFAGLPQVPGVVDRRSSEQAMQPLAPCASRSRLGVLLLGLELDSEAIGERLERPLEVQSFGLHHERERIAGGLAAKAVVVLLVGANMERRRALVVERAEPEEAVDPGPAQFGPRRDERHHVDGVADPVPGVRGVSRHGANAAGTLSASNALMQKRSVMPAM